MFEEHLSPEERRQFERHKVPPSQRYYLVKRMDGTVLGHIMDISQGGLKLKGPNPFEEGNVQTVEVELPYSFFSRTSITLDMICRWSEAFAGSSDYMAGFEYEDPSRVDRLFIEKCMSLSTNERLKMSLFGTPIEL